jgi:hypothetical protein
MACMNMLGMWGQHVVGEQLCRYSPTIGITLYICIGKNSRIAPGSSSPFWMFLSLSSLTVCHRGAAFHPACIGAQVFYPELQKRRIAAARQKRFHDAAMVALESHAVGHGSLIDASGHVKKDVAHHVFQSIDTDENGYIDESMSPSQTRKDGTPCMFVSCTVAAGCYSLTLMKLIH